MLKCGFCDKSLSRYESAHYSVHGHYNCPYNFELIQERLMCSFTTDKYYYCLYFDAKLETIEKGYVYKLIDRMISKPLNIDLKGFKYYDLLVANVDKKIEDLYLLG